MKSLVRFALVFLGVHLAAVEPVTLNWLGGNPPATGANVTWGVPCPKGAIKVTTPMQLTAANHQIVDVQTWPLAYWPDGSVKWTGHAVTAAAGLAGPFLLTPG